MTYTELYDKAEHLLNTSKINLGEFIEMIKPLNSEIPQVIHCKDCKYCEPQNEFHTKVDCKRLYISDGIFASHLRVDPEKDFCSKGYRKENNEY